MNPVRGRLPAVPVHAGQAGGPKVNFTKMTNPTIVSSGNQVRAWTILFASYL